MIHAPSDRLKVRRHNLPAELTSFVGRASQIVGLGKVIPAHRLVTITGAGGGGKTRLANRVAGELLGEFSDGVWLVELAALTDPELVPHRIATAVGATEVPGRRITETLLHFLATKHLLLVLDNCEHLADACAPLVEELLQTVSGVQILATSREPLNLDAEIVWPVPPLSMPQRGTQLPIELLAQFEAIRLFVDRARVRQPGFALTPANARAVTNICHQLDGIPLAIELAASLISAISPEQIVERLDDALPLLVKGRRTPARQQTLRATLDWSYALLTAREQIALRRLTVFAGGFDLAAVEKVTGENGIEPAAVAVLLSDLVDKSLVVVLTETTGRYRLLETVRQYASERLRESGEADLIHDRHARFFRDLIEGAEAKLRSGDREPWLERLAADEDNVRAALAWSWRAFEDGSGAELQLAETGPRIVGPLFWFWYMRGNMSEGAYWLTRAAQRLEGVSASVRAKVLFGAGGMAWLQGEYPLARRRFELAASLQEDLGDKSGRALTLAILTTILEAQGEQDRADAGLAESRTLFRDSADRWGLGVTAQVAGLQAYHRGDYASAQARLQEGLALFRQEHDRWFTAEALNILGDVARIQGELDQATVFYQESLALVEAQGKRSGTASLLQNLGYVAFHQNHLGRSIHLFQQALTIFREKGDRRGVAECLAGLGCVATAQRNLAEAVRLLGAVQALLDALGSTLWPSNRVDYESARASTRGLVDERSFASHWAEGQAAPLAEILTLALSLETTEDPPIEEPSRQQMGATLFQLTRREREVAGLLVGGLTNRQVAEALVISEGTAAVHVKRILSKLGFSSRAQIAVWASEHGLRMVGR